MMSRSNDIAVRRKPARTLREKGFDNRRDQLKDSAARIFRIKGYHAANLADIARESGIDRATIYYYFSGKEEIFQEIVLDVTKLNVEMVKAVAASDEYPATKLKTLVVNLMESYATNYPHLFLYLQENTSQIAEASPWSNQMAALTREFQNAVVSLIDSGARAGVFRLPEKQDARLVANALIGMCNWSHKWFTPDKSWTAAEVGDTFASIFLSGILIVHE